MTRVSYIHSCVGAFSPRVTVWVSRVWDGNSPSASGKLIFTFVCFFDCVQAGRSSRGLLGFPFTAFGKHFYCSDRECFASFVHIFYIHRFNLKVSIEAPTKISEKRRWSLRPQKNSFWLLPQKCWLRMRACCSLLSLSAWLGNETPFPYAFHLVACVRSPAASSLPLLLMTTILSSQTKEKLCFVFEMNTFSSLLREKVLFSCVVEGFFHQLCFSFSMFVDGPDMKWIWWCFALFHRSASASQLVELQMFVVSEWKGINSKPKENFAELWKYKDEKYAKDQ